MEQAVHQLLSICQCISESYRIEIAVVEYRERRSPDESWLRSTASCLWLQRTWRSRRRQADDARRQHMSPTHASPGNTCSVYRVTQEITGLWSLWVKTLSLYILHNYTIMLRGGSAVGRGTCDWQVRPVRFHMTGQLSLASLRGR